MNINTRNICPPIPVRRYDWEATLDDYEPGDAIGYGETEQEARADLVRTLCGGENHEEVQELWREL